MKACLLGNTNAGKTCLSHNIVGHIYNEFHSSTIGANFLCKFLPNNISNQLILWDTAGQERYRSIVPMYIRGSHVVIIVICKSNDGVESTVKYWLDQSTKYIDDNCNYIVLFSKVDEDKNKPTLTDINNIKNILDNYNIQAPILQHSSKTNYGLKELLSNLTIIGYNIKKDNDDYFENIRDNYIITHTSTYNKCCIIL